MLNTMYTLLSETFEQGPLDGLDIRWIWGGVGLAVAAVLVGLLIWRSVVGWKERIRGEGVKIELEERASAEKRGNTPLPQELTPFADAGKNAGENEDKTE